MQEPTIIKALGGAKEVGDRLRERGLKVEDVTVRSWTLPGRSIPAKYWVHVADIARSKNVSLSFERMAQQVAA